MKVLLIQPPHYYSGGHSTASYFPLGLGYIAKALLKSGHEVEVLDIWAHDYSKEEVVGRVRKMDWDVVGITALSTQYAYIKWLASELEKCNPNKIVVGGVLATLSPEVVLRNTEADICVIGEGEVTCKETLANLDRLENVRGICFKQNDEIIKNPPQEYIKDLDSIEFPAWDLFPVEIYTENGRLEAHPKVKVMRVLVGRGCPYQCRYCSKTFTRNRFRSAANVVEEIKEFVGRYPQVKGVSFADELLVVNKRRMYEICDAIEPLHMKWSGQARVDLVDLDLLKRMKRAGCAVISYGVESGSQTILDNMNKRATVEQGQNTLRDTIKAGITPRIQMMYGYPGETRETLRETVNFFRGLPYLSVRALSIERFSRTTPFPGTALYDQALKEGLIGKEEEYLENLSAGRYIPGALVPGVNLTKFSEKEFYQLKRKTENEIFWNNIRGHPFHFAWDYTTYLFSRVAADLIEVVPYLRRHGFKQTIRRAIRIALIPR